MIRVTEINELSELASYRLLWQALLPQTPRASFFQSLDWLEVYLSHYGHDQRLRVLVVHAGGHPIGILPLVVRTEQTRLGQVRLLTYPLHDWGTFYGPIGPNPTATLIAGLQHIRRTERDWEVLDLRWVDLDGADRGRTERALENAGFNPQHAPWMRCAKIDLAGDWDSYWATRTSHWRTNVRRSEKRVAELGPVTYLRYRPQGAAYGEGDPRWDLYDACEQVAGASWQAASQTGTTLTHDEVRGFFRDAHEVAARAGAVDLNLLYVDGRPIAFNYAYQYRGYVFGLRMGYDAHATKGAGTVLQMHMIRDSFNRGDHTYDLGAEYLGCKRFWPTHILASHRYTYFPPRIRPQVLRLKRSLEGAWRRSPELEDAENSKAPALR